MYLSTCLSIYLASLLFDPPEPQIIGKTHYFATVPPFRAPGSSFFWLFLFSDRLTSKLPSNNVILYLFIYAVKQK